MPDFNKLAKGRQAFAKPKVGESGKPAAKPEKPLAESCREEIGEIEAAFQNRLKSEDGRCRAATDSEFWFCLYFPDRGAKDRFLRKYGLDRIGDKYLSGGAVDRILQLRADKQPDRHSLPGSGHSRRAKE